GRPCAKCYKCRDWHFTGNRDDWNWICNYNNWRDEDWERWRNDRDKLFKKRDGATCIYRFIGGIIRFHLCLCEMH
ncbi:unnamed protein product, partial [Rotaria sordida]